MTLNQNTPSTDLKSVKIGDEVTDGFSKSGHVEKIEIKPKGSGTEYLYTLVTGAQILVIR